MPRHAPARSLPAAALTSSTGVLTVKRWWLRRSSCSAVLHRSAPTSASSPCSRRSLRSTLSTLRLVDVRTSSASTSPAESSRAQPLRTTLVMDGFLPRSRIAAAWRGGIHVRNSSSRRSLSTTAFSAGASHLPSLRKKSRHGLSLRMLAVAAMKASTRSTCSGLSAGAGVGTRADFAQGDHRLAGDLCGVALGAADFGVSARCSLRFLGGVAKNFFGVAYTMGVRGARFVLGGK